MTPRVHLWSEHFAVNALPMDRYKGVTYQSKSFGSDADLDGRLRLRSV